MKQLNEQSILEAQRPLNAKPRRPDSTLTPTSRQPSESEQTQNFVTYAGKGPGQGTHGKQTTSYQATPTLRFNQRIDRAT